MSYLWFFYYTHTDLGNEPIPSMKSALVASLTMEVSTANPQIANQFFLSNDHQSLKEFRAAAKERERAAGVLPSRDKPRSSICLNLLCLAGSIPALVLASIYVLESIGAPTESFKLSESFVGLVVIPSILASVEQVTTALRSHKYGIAWIVEGAFGSSIRISLFVFPVAVVLGWILGTNMDMILDGFQVVVLCLAILLVNHVIHNAFTHW